MENINKYDKCIENLVNALNGLKDGDGSNKFLSLTIEVDDDFNLLESDNINHLCQEFGEYSLLLHFVTNVGDKLLIYWKLENSKNLLKVNFIRYNDAQHLFQIVSEFLTKCLKSGHLGLTKVCSEIEHFTEVDISYLADSRNYNLLLLASESGNASDIECLQKYGFVTETEDGINAQNLAWSGHHYDALLKLLQFNIPFPDSFKPDECTGELKEFINISKEFHRSIREGNKKKLGEIREQHPNLRHFLNFHNESALKVAIRKRMLDIYMFLINQGLRIAKHENIDSFLGSLETKDRRKLREFNLKHSKQMPDRHINILMMNTIIFDESDVEGKKQLIQSAFAALDRNEYVNIIFKIVAARLHFLICFDFSRNTTDRVDPNTDSGTLGIFYSTGRIIIGAKDLLDEETKHNFYGVLAHELCHFAMGLVYENSENPYKKDDDKTKKEFQGIIDKCRDLCEGEEIISGVYDYEESDHPSELIVRVPQLMAKYLESPKLLEKLQRDFIDLFDFFIKVTFAKMEQSLEHIEATYSFKLFQTFEDLPNKSKEIIKNAIVIYKDESMTFDELFPSDSSYDSTVYKKLTPDNIRNLLNKKVLNLSDENAKVLNESVNLFWGNLPEKLRKKFLQLKCDFQGESVELRQVNETKPDAFQSLTCDQIVRVLSGEEFLIGNKVNSNIKFYIERKFIREDAKLIYLKYKNVQNGANGIETNVPFDEFLISFNAQPLKACFNIFDNIISNSEIKGNFCNLNDEIFKFMHKNSEELIEQAVKEKILILSSEAGAGKTATFEQLAIQMKKKFPTRWVSYIDLKDHSNISEKSRTAENFIDILKEILNLDFYKNAFEVEIFEDSLKYGQVVLLWNGFDETSSLNDFVLNLIDQIYKYQFRNYPKNIQFVCTRPLYSKQLRNKFETVNMQLIPFSDCDKNMFVRNYLINENVPFEEIDQHMEKTKKVKTVDKLIRVFDTPFLLKIVGEASKESLNLFEIFENLVLERLEIWSQIIKTVGIKSENIVYKFSWNTIKKLYQKYAINYKKESLFYTSDLLKNAEKLQIMQFKIPKKFPLEEISRMGILYINEDDKYEFGHDVFSEFFVAQYFIENIYNADNSIDEGEAELRLDLFFNFFKCFDTKHKLLLDFMHYYLKSEATESFCDEISELLKTKYVNFLVDLLNTKYPYIYDFLFDFFKKDRELFMKLLHVNEDETLYTAIFNPIHFAKYTDPEKIKGLTRKFLLDEEHAKFLNGKNQKGVILYGIYFYKMIDVKKVNDTYNVQINELCSKCCYEIVNRIKNILTRNELKSFEKVIANSKISACVISRRNTI